LDDFLWGEDCLLGDLEPPLAAIFISDAVMPSKIYSSESAIIASTSSGVASTDRGCFPNPFFLGLGGGIATGDGHRDGSFSFEDIEGSSYSSSSPSSGRQHPKSSSSFLDCSDAVSLENEGLSG
jgi:hypothetical protein